MKILRTASLIASLVACPFAQASHQRNTPVNSVENFVLVRLEDKKRWRHAFLQGGVTVEEVLKFMTNQKVKNLWGYDGDLSPQEGELGDDKEKKLFELDWFKDKGSLHPSSHFASKGALEFNKVVRKALASSELSVCTAAFWGVDAEDSATTFMRRAYGGGGYKYLDASDFLDCRYTYIITNTAQGEAKTWREVFGDPSLKPAVYLTDNHFVFFKMVREEQRHDGPVHFVGGHLFAQGGVWLGAIKRFMAGRGITELWYYSNQKDRPSRVDLRGNDKNRQRLSDQAWFHQLNQKIVFANEEKLKTSEFVREYLPPRDPDSGFGREFYMQVEKTYVITKTPPQKAQTWTAFAALATVQPRLRVAGKLVGSVASSEAVITLGDDCFALFSMEDEEEEYTDLFIQGGVTVGAIKKIIADRKVEVLGYYDKTLQEQEIELEELEGKEQSKKTLTLGDDKGKKLAELDWFKSSLHPATQFANKEVLKNKREIWEALAFSDRYNKSVGIDKLLKGSYRAQLKKGPLPPTPPHLYLMLKKTYVITAPSGELQTWVEVFGSPRSRLPHFYLNDNYFALVCVIQGIDQAARAIGYAFIQGGVKVRYVKSFMADHGASALEYYTADSNKNRMCLCRVDLGSEDSAKLSDQDWFHQRYHRTEFADVAGLKEKAPQRFASRFRLFPLGDAYVITNDLPQKAQMWKTFAAPAAAQPTNNQLGVRPDNPNANNLSEA